MLSLGAKVCLSQKIHRAAVGGNPNSVNVFMLGLPLFQNRLGNRRRIPCALKLHTGLRSAKKAQGGKPFTGDGGARKLGFARGRFSEPLAPPAPALLHWRMMDYPDRRATGA